jgi:hypothetical protein
MSTSGSDLPRPLGPALRKLQYGLPVWEKLVYVIIVLGAVGTGIMFGNLLGSEIDVVGMFLGFVVGLAPIAFARPVFLFLAAWAEVNADRY